MQLRLTLHPAAGPAPFSSLVANLRRERGRLHIEYRVTGAVSALVLPRATAPARVDGLWRTTCFEVFLRPGAGAAYAEFNFSPSSAWAAYRFDDYRRGAANAAVAAPEITTSAAGRAFTLSACLDLRHFALTPSARLGLSAVLETTDGAISFWALAHAGDKPDFHRADGFIARLPYESSP